MPRITSYTAVGQSQGKTALADADVFAVDGINAVRKITAKELANASIDKFQKMSSSRPCGKSCFYRGANLGSGATFLDASTAAQRAAIANGTFEGLFIGDYWTVNNRLYRIADFDYWLHSGDTDFNTHHVVLLPDSSFGNGQMNPTNTATGAYVGSDMYNNASSVLNTARNTIANDFGGYLAQHRVYLPNAITGNAQSAGAWYDSTVELMNEKMVYGTFIRCCKNSGVYLYTVDKDQLALFQLNPAMVNLRYNYWLRDVVSAAFFASVDAYGLAYPDRASDSRGVRPVFPVKGTA